MSALNRLLSLLLGLALLGGGLLVAAEAASELLGFGELVVPVRDWVASLRDTAYEDTAARAAFAACAAAGLLLLVAELWRRPPRRLSLASEEHRQWWLLRRPLERQLGRDLAERSGARRVRVHLRGRREPRAHVLVDGAREVRPEVEQLARERLGGLLGRTPRRLRVQLRRQERVA